MEESIAAIYFTATPEGKTQVHFEVVEGNEDCISAKIARDIYDILVMGSLEKDQLH